MPIRRYCIWAALAAASVIVAAPAEAQTERPRLVLQITVDQLRGDLLDRHEE